MRKKRFVLNQIKNTLPNTILSKLTVFLKMRLSTNILQILY